MNCQIANDLLIDLLYDELDATTAAKVREHIHHCPSCAAAWEKLSLGAAAASAAMADEPAGSPTFLPPARFAVWRKWALTAAAAAAIFLAVLGLWHLAGGTSAPVIAAPAGPPEMVRKSVSLTILSKPASWDAGYQRGSWPGMALIRDQRIARNLRPGESTIEFANVPANILPDSVRLRSRSNPGGLKILEQNYQFDLASAAAVLDRYIDKTITVTLQDGTAHTGRLLSADPERTPYPYLPDYREYNPNWTLLLEPDRQGPMIITGRQIASIAFGSLPKGLRTRPALLWQLDNRGGDHDLEVSYLSWNIDWKADYVLKINGETETEKDPAGRPILYDTVDIVGYATVTNNSGVRFDNAQLKLMAGDTRILSRPPWWGRFRTLRWAGESESPADYMDKDYDNKAGFTQKAFFEYHLYTLGRPTTLANQETKQIEMLTANDVRMQRRYVYHPYADPHVRVQSVLENSEENAMGQPLPKGTVRLYAPGPAGVDEFVKHDTIDHTPKDEKIDFFWGHAFDLVGQMTLKDETKLGPGHFRRTAQITLRNHKSHDVTITVILDVPRSTYQVDCKLPWYTPEVSRVEVPIVVQANSQNQLELTYTFNTTKGGGLQSPHQK